MYHRFNENKYPSTNIRIEDFKKHIDIINDKKIKFINPNEFEESLNNLKKERKIKNSKIKKLFITDTIDNSKKIKNNNKIEVLSISSLMAEAIKRISNSTSVSDLFN